MKHATIVTAGLGLAAVSLGLAAGLVANVGQASSNLRPAGEWAADNTWYDGLVEKAVYDAEKVIYGHPRQYEATFLTNKERHDPQTWTKSLDGGGGGGSDGVEVWKHNQIEVVPTPNYDYKFVTTSHATVDGLAPTRLDAASQEWCGTTFHQYLRNDGSLDYFAFSYMPEEGRQSGTVSLSGSAPTVAFNSLPLVLRGYDFVGREDLSFRMLPDQKSNKFVEHAPVDATVSFAGETEEGYRLKLTAAGEEIGTFEFARDRMHVMLSYKGVNGDSYELKELDRINYWTRDEE